MFTFLHIVNIVKLYIIMKIKNKTYKFQTSFIISTTALSAVIVLFSFFIFTIKASALGIRLDHNNITRQTQNIASGATATDDPACNDKDPSTKCEIVADCNTGTTPDQNLHPDNCGITSMIAKLTNILTAVVGIILIIVIILAGIQYSASSGDPQAAAAAKQRITNAAIALLAFTFMYGFLQWIIPGGLF